MDLLTLVVGLPFAPLRGLVAVAELLRREAERELYDPSSLRRQLEEVEAAVASGELSSAEGERRQQEILGALTAPPAPDARDSDRERGPERR